MTGIPQKGASVATGPQTLLTFGLMGELFGIAVAHVQEIIDPLPTIHVPGASDFARGLVNVRGSVVPVVDLRQRLRMPERSETGDSRLIVLEILLEGERTKLAIVADSVETVVDISAEDIEPVPEIGIRWPVQYLDGVARRDGDLVILLRPEVLFRPADPKVSMAS